VCVVDGVVAAAGFVIKNIITTCVRSQLLFVKISSVLASHRMNTGLKRYVPLRFLFVEIYEEIERVYSATVQYATSNNMLLFWC
jgi:hypothetical protein